MHLDTTHRPRLPGRALVVVLGVALAVLGPTVALGAAGEPDPVGVWPLVPQPEVVRAFDPPDSTWGPGHRGADLLGSPGQPVRTALGGVVSFTGVIAGRGVVVVDHGDTRTTYEPVDAVVAVGDAVRGGDRIGTLEAGPAHCPPRTCLHWGWIRGETYLDPLGLVGAGPVRLLPLWRAEPVTGGIAGPAPSSRPLPLLPPVPVGPYAGWQPLVLLAAAP